MNILASNITLSEGPCNGAHMCGGINGFPYASAENLEPDIKVGEFVGKLRFGLKEISMMVRTSAPASEYHVYRYQSNDRFVFVKTVKIGD